MKLLHQPFCIFHSVVIYLVSQRHLSVMSDFICGAAVVHDKERVQFPLFASMFSVSHTLKGSNLCCYVEQGSTRRS